MNAAPKAVFLSYASQDAEAARKICEALRGAGVEVWFDQSEPRDRPFDKRKADRLLVNIVGGADLTLPKVNELMSAITEQFGRESHIIMGAVIDEGMPGRVEICVIGTSDMGGRALPVRRPAAPARGKTPPPARAENGSIVPLPAPPAGAPSTHAGRNAVTVTTRTVQAEKIAQEEFGFGEVESRGHFEKTDRNLFDGQDLDVPTYLRKGIKVVI